MAIKDFVSAIDRPTRQLYMDVVIPAIDEYFHNLKHKNEFYQS